MHSRQMPTPATGWLYRYGIWLIARGNQWTVPEIVCKRSLSKITKREESIWGLIDFHGAPESEVAERLSDAYRCYRIDRYEKLSGGGAEFGCCHQYLTKEAVSEQLPVYDKERNLLFTADCVLDNRDELLALLPECGEMPSDGQLLLAAYLKWGSALGDYCLGAFAFAAFHTDTKTLALCTDHMGNRSLFYSRQGERFIFSTAVLPLAKLCQAIPSEQWLSGCLFSTSSDMTLFKGLTQEAPHQDDGGFPDARRMHDDGYKQQLQPDNLLVSPEAAPRPASAE